MEKELYNYKKKGKEYINNKLEYEGEYLCNKKWNGKGYDKNGNIIYELKNGNDILKEYENNKLIFVHEYLNGNKNVKRKNMNFLVDYNLKKNILMEKDEKEKNIMI